MTGKNMIPNRNDLVRTIEPNSVDATIQIFRRSVCKFRLLYVLGCGDPNEDVVQRRAGDLEVGDPGTGHQGFEQPLVVADPFHFLDVAVVGDFLDSRDALERGCSLVSLDPNGVEAVKRLDLVEGAIQD